jgi:hypothetical protein
VLFDGRLEARPHGRPETDSGVGCAPGYAAGGQTEIRSSAAAAAALAAGTVGATNLDLPATYGERVSGGLLADMGAGMRVPGAPLLDTSGRVIGVLERRVRSGGSAELWLAAPIDGAAHVISDVNAG